MDKPRIDIAKLPDLPTRTGVFGSQSDTSRCRAADDSTVIMMTFIYSTR